MVQVLLYTCFVKSNTNWNLYKTFVTVFELKNMSHSATELGVTRAAIGQNIRELENQLGTKLFTPDKRGVIPTAEAVKIYPSIKKVTQIIHETESDLSTDRKSVV